MLSNANAKNISVIQGFIAIKAWRLNASLEIWDYVQGGKKNTITQVAIGAQNFCNHTLWISCSI